MAKPATKKTDAPAASVAAPTPAPAAEAAPVDTKVKKTKAVKAEPVAAAPAPTPAPVAAAPAEEVAAPADENALVDRSVDFLAKLNQIGALLSALKVEYRTLEKAWSKEIKAAQKLGSKRKRKAGTRAPSGFVKPTKISDELASFLGKDKGTEMARTDVTREINTYIRSHNLQDKDNGRKINPDSKLATLLKLKKTDELTYFNLQKYMSIHFAKASAPAPVTA
jgi:chromatin remodeling complex protein RSC6